MSSFRPYKKYVDIDKNVYMSKMAYKSDSVVAWLLNEKHVYLQCM